MQKKRSGSPCRIAGSKAPRMPRPDHCFFPSDAALLEQKHDLRLYNIKRHVIHTAVDDDIRLRTRRVHIQVVHRFDRGQILIHDIVQDLFPAP